MIGMLHRILIQHLQRPVKVACHSIRWETVTDGGLDLRV